MMLRLSRSITSIWFLALLLTYIFGLDFSTAMPLIASLSTLMSATFSPAVVSTMLTIAYVWCSSAPPLRT